jgi:hypothetical protein
MTIEIVIIVRNNMCLLLWTGLDWTGLDWTGHPCQDSIACTKVIWNCFGINEMGIT